MRVLLEPREIGRPTDHLRQIGDQAFKRKFAGRAARNVFRLRRQFFLHRTHRARERLLRQITFHATFKLSARGALEAGQPLFPIGMGAL